MLANFILWCITHATTIEALLLTAMIAFVAGMATQFCQDDKKAAQHANVEQPIKGK